MTFCSFWKFNINTFWTVIESDLLDLSERRNATFGFPVSNLLSKCGIYSTFLQAQGFLLSFSWSKTNVSWNPMAIRTQFYDSLGYGQRQSNRCVSWWNLRVSNVSSHLLGCYNKRRWSPSRMTSLQAMYYFVYVETFTIPSDRSEMVAICSICSIKIAPSRPEVKWDA